MQTDEGRRAYAVYRTLPNPAPAQPVTKVVEPTPSPSFLALRKLAAELSNREPSLTPDQALTKVYADPRNRELVAAERSENRPSAEAPVAKTNRGRIADRVAALAGALGQQFPSLSCGEAFDLVLARNPALADAYRQAAV